MTVESSVLIQSQAVETTQTTKYIATNCRAIVDFWTVTNTSAGALTYSANVVPAGGAPTADNLIVQAKSIAPGETWVATPLIGRRLAPGDFLSTVASAAGLNQRAEGRRIT